ncbi:hypothetical protein V6N12_007645 [Hibiscus sabdariffa]|uniref:RNase H type-1 domain-containing protein n=1 Tax=Hibiscus sabdariffa TaxID=183260 RepID=A0ABR2F2E4_9ROSI
MRNSGLGSIGGVFRDFNGEFLFGFAKKIGIIDAFQAELWAILIGLDLALRLDHKHLIVQCNNYDVVGLLSQPTLFSPHPLVQSILQVLSLTFDVQFVHIYRESNMAADFMAKIDAPPDRSLLRSLLHLPDCPSFLLGTS